MLNIRDFVDLDAFQKIQDRFSDATGVAAIAVGADGKYITEPSNFTDFCMKYTRGCPEGERRCIKCDTECTGTYYCHAGLMDFSIDLMIGDEKVGAIIGGQVLPAPPDEEKFRAIARELGINEDSYIDALRKVPVRSEKTIHAAAEVLGTVMNMLVNFKYLQTSNGNQMEVFKNELGSITGNIESAKGLMSDLHNTSTMEHILSINANIEAAKAGKAGVGFAVVAREIGELSKQSGSVYDEIERLVDEIQTSVDKIIRSGK
ncbi:MAG: chemotaxis protein [Ruminococcaceae bacterium]|nr:chemotaxis protein [Oscillospiraceae bacterium]MBD5116054.1 chemotaxis protein [Oscillospiraceae bacterium]